ncbi:hypothetical protein CXB51_024090 [Gossypium anomalum]|uniref:MADS-box domain-containing protein n=1 Tax=Gossypium anomalum TaxID=47600 RepID=A0A8J6CSA6_9ROSI|nr:hypothetical protein CXB51_024090 [Gossypium anomalum]
MASLATILKQTSPLLHPLLKAVCKASNDGEKPQEKEATLGEKGDGADNPVWYRTPDFERIKKMTNLETYMKEKISRLQDQLEKMNRKNMELEAGQFMLQIHQGNSSNTTACGTTAAAAAAAFTTEDLEIVPSKLTCRGNVLAPHLDRQTPKSTKLSPSGRSISVLGNSNIMKGDALELPPDEEGPLRPPFSEGSSSNVIVDHLRLPRPPSGGSSSASPFMIFEFPNTDIDLPEGDNLGLFGGQDVGPGHYPLGPLGSSYPARTISRSSVVKAAAAVVPQAVELDRTFRSIVAPRHGMAIPLVKLAWIADNAARRASPKKRRLGLVKKVMELTTLCGTEACLVIYSPDEQVWPSYDEVQRLIKKFYQAPEFESIKKMMNLETYMQEKISMLQDQLEKLKGKTWNLRQGSSCSKYIKFHVFPIHLLKCILIKHIELEATQFMLQIHQGKMLDDFNVNKLDCLIWYVEIMWTDIRKRREYYQQFPSSSATPAQGYVPLPPPSQSPATTDQIGDAKAMVRGEASSNISSGGELLGPPYGGAGDSSLAPHLRLQGPSFGASSRVAAEEGPLRPPFSEGSSSNVVVDHLKLQRPTSGGSSSTSPFMIFEFPNTDTDLPEGDNLGLFGGQDVGPGHYPLGPQASSYRASEFGWNCFEVFSGESSSNSGATSASETEETS